MLLTDFFKNLFQMNKNNKIVDNFEKNEQNTIENEISDEELIKQEAIILEIPSEQESKQKIIENYFIETNPHLKDNLSVDAWFEAFYNYRNNGDNKFNINLMNFLKTLKRILEHKGISVDFDNLKDSCIEFIGNKNKEKRQIEALKEEEVIKQEQNKAEQLKELIMPTIDKFVKLHIDESIKFPHFVLIDDKNSIKALQQLINNENNIDINLDFLEYLINEELKTQIFSIFKKSFLELNPAIRDSKNLQDWVDAYVDTFGENKNYFSTFINIIEHEEIFVILNDEEKETKIKELANMSGLSFKQMAITGEIITTIQKRSISKLAENLSLVMKKGEKLINSSNTTIDEIDKMAGLEFEHFLCDLYSKNGYKAEVTKASGDQGADLIIEKFGERTVVQAKRYSGVVTNTAIQEVVGAKAHYNCSKAMVVTNSYFTKSAMELANSNDVELVDREKLEEKLKDYNLSHF